MLINLANITLVRLSEAMKDFECQGDTVSYKCALYATSNDHILTWTVTYQGFPPIVVTHNDVSESDVNSTLALDINSFSTLTVYRSLSLGSIYLESILTLWIRSYISIKVNCSFLELANALMTLTVLGKL